jgi:chaperonin GroES
MKSSITRDIEAWEDEGGAAPATPGIRAAPMIGCPPQPERAARPKVSGRARPCEVIPIDRWKETLGGKLEANSMMNIRPLYDRIVVKRIEEQETTRNGIVIPDSAKEKPQEGEVMAVGRGKRLEDGKVVALDVAVGDRILFGKYSGSETKLDGTEYIIMREDDVLGVLDSPAGPAKKGT